MNHENCLSSTPYKIFTFEEYAKGMLDLESRNLVHICILSRPSMRLLGLTLCNVAYRPFWVDQNLGHIYMSHVWTNSSSDLNPIDLELGGRVKPRLEINSFQILSFWFKAWTRHDFKVLCWKFDQKIGHFVHCTWSNLLIVILHPKQEFFI